MLVLEVLVLTSRVRQPCAGNIEADVAREYNIVRVEAFLLCSAIIKRFQRETIIVVYFTISVF
jgi:hypothetical protein